MTKTWHISIFQTEYLSNTNRTEYALGPALKITQIGNF